MKVRAAGRNGLICNKTFDSGIIIEGWVEREARNPTWIMGYELLGFATLYPTFYDYSGVKCFVAN
jgi:hypothetical protein